MTCASNEAVNKNHININNICENKEKIKDVAMIIPINKKPLLNYFDQTLDLLNEKAENKKKYVTKSEKDNFHERQSVEETKKKYFLYYYYN